MTDARMPDDDTEYGGEHGPATVPSDYAASAVDEERAQAAVRPAIGRRRPTRAAREEQPPNQSRSSAPSTLLSEHCPPEFNPPPQSGDGCADGGVSDRLLV